jgi:hypothetical protein
LSAPSALTSCVVSGTTSPRVEQRRQVEDHRDLELAPEPLEEVSVEDVAHASRRAAGGQRRLERAQVEGEDVEGAEVGEPVDEAVPHLAAGAGHEHDGPARHGSLLTGVGRSSSGRAA